MNFTELLERTSDIARSIAQDKHSHQYRKFSKEPYFKHPSRVADTVARFTNDDNIISAAYGFIYLTTNLINGKKYIGQKAYSSGNNDEYLGSGIHLSNAIKKYGSENFKREIIEICDDCESLNMAEIFYIWRHNAVNNNMYYNLAYGGNDYNTMLSILPKNEKELFLKNKAIKAAKTMSLKQNSGLTIRQTASLKQRETLKNKILKNGLSISENAGLKLSKTLSKIESNGKTKAINRALKAAKTRKLNNKKLTNEEIKLKCDNNSGKHWWNNGIKSILVFEIPNDGNKWVRGRI